ncbi:MAG: hypothetical protein E4H10_14370, partial [Bacteroidia bacterium]
MNHKISKLFIILIMALMIYSSQDLSAQIIELNAFTGWQLNGKAKLYEGEIRLNDAQNYGGKLAYGISTSTFVEVSYMRTDTEGQFFPYYAGTPGDKVALSENIVQIGGLQQMDLGRISPFATLAAGLTVWSPKTSGYTGYTQFSFSFGAGVKIWLTDFLGIRLQGTMLMPLVYQGAGLGCGIGT